LDGRGVIIFGGFNVIKTDSLYILDTISLEWYTPNVTGQIPANRYNHGANVIGNYMVVSFGKYFAQFTVIINIIIILIYLIIHNLLY
jgi:hypothetical protein